VDLERIVAENSAWVEAGEYRRAIDRMRALIRTDPHDLELRRELARVYRSLGHPDQAGRWGYIVPDGASDEERSRFIVGYRNSYSVRRINELLLLEKNYPLVPDPQAFGSAPWRARDSPGVRIGEKVGGWVLAALVIALVGGALVFINALVGGPWISNSAWATVLLFLGVVFVGLLLQTVSSALQRRAKSALVAGFSTAIAAGLFVIVILSGAVVASSIR
jgi:uncharacterized membrane protein